MIKEGNDHFEVSQREPKVDFCEKKYVFDAIRAPNTTRDPVFNASAKCPAYAIADDLADAVRAKQEADNAEYRQAGLQGRAGRELNTGIDGGMNKVFASHVPGASTGLSEGGDGRACRCWPFARARHHSPDCQSAARPWSPQARKSLWSPRSPPLHAACSDNPRRRAAECSNPKAGSPASPTRSASAPPTPPPAHSRPNQAKGTEAKRHEPSSRPVTSASKTTSKPEVKQAAAHPPLKSAISEAHAAAAPPAQESLVAGSQPIVQANSFESRFSGFK